MPFNITIDHATTANSSDRSSTSTDEEDSTGTGVQVSPTSAAGSQEYSDPAEEHEGSWTNVYADEIGPSDSASRPRTSNQQRPLVEAPQPQEARRPQYRRHITQERTRNLPHPRAHRAPPSESESVDSHEEWRAYAQGPPQQYRHNYAHYAAAAGYPSHAFQQYQPPSVVAPGQQQIVPYGFPAYQQHAPPPGPSHSYFGHHGVSGHEMMPHTSHPGFYPYPQHHQQGFTMPVSPPPAMYQPYPVIFSPPPPTPASAPAPAPTPAPVAAPTDPPLAAASSPTPPETSRDDEKFARLEKLFLDEKADRDAREAAAAKALKDVEAKAKADKEKAEEIAAASSAAAAAAKAEAQQEYKDAAEKAAAEAAAEASSAAAAAAAAAAAVPPPPPKEKDKPIKFKDAIGRRFNFPFHMCNTWTGMEYLIKEAFLHVENYGPHVAEGMYDLLGPHGEIVMNSVWETVVEPGWEISMHMWPLPEPPEIDPLVEGLADIVIVDEGVPPPPPPLPSASGEKGKGKKKKEKAPPFMLWAGGSKKKKAAKPKKK